MDIDKLSLNLTPNRFIPIDDESETVLEGMGKLEGKVNEGVDKININNGRIGDLEIDVAKKEYSSDITNKRKLSTDGDFTGSWHGVPFTQSEGGMSADFNQARLPFPTLTDKINDMVGISELIDEKLTEVSNKVNIRNTGFYNVLEYGISPEKTASENTLALNNLFSTVVKGDTIIFPKGVYLVNNLIVPPVNNLTLVFIGELKASSTGTTLKIGSETQDINNLIIKGLKISRVTRDIINGNIGLDIVNSYSGSVDIVSIQDHNINLRLRGNNGIGSSYNNFNLNNVFNGKTNILLTAENNGWCNENNFYGGHLSFTSGLVDYTDHVHLIIEHYNVHQLNNNKFYNTSFESTNNALTKACIINGNNNFLYSPRLEKTSNDKWVDGIELTSNSRFIVVFYGYGIIDNAVKNNGVDNKIFKLDSTFLSGQGTVLELKNNFSNASKILSGKDLTNSERFYVTGSGQLWAYQTGYFGNGIRFNTGDLTFNDRGIFLGNGSPEGVVSARVGSLYLNQSGGAGITLYVKETGIGNTGWVAK